MTNTDRFILETICERDGQWNWYKLGRYCISRLENPAGLTLKPLLDAGFIEERTSFGEPLPRLHITESGKIALQEKGSAEGSKNS